MNTEFEQFLEANTGECWVLDDKAISGIHIREMVGIGMIDDESYRVKYEGGYGILEYM